MSLNDRLATKLASMLAKHGFDVTLQQRVGQSTDELEPDESSWTDLATVKALWDNPRSQYKGVNDGGPVSVTQRRMTISYRDDLKTTPSAIDLRVVCNGVAHNVLAVSEIGDKVGLRLLLESGMEPTP